MYDSRIVHDCRRRRIARASLKSQRAHVPSRDDRERFGFNVLDAGAAWMQQLARRRARVVAGTRACTNEDVCLLLVNRIHGQHELLVWVSRVWGVHSRRVRDGTECELGRPSMCVTCGTA